MTDYVESICCVSQRYCLSLTDDDYLSTPFFLYQSIINNDSQKKTDVKKATFIMCSASSSYDPHDLLQPRVHGYFVLEC
jgi:hypothetical protein